MKKRGVAADNGSVTIRLTTLIAGACAVLAGLLLLSAYLVDRPRPGVLRAPACENVEYVHMQRCAWTGRALLRLRRPAPGPVPALEFVDSPQQAIGGPVDGWGIFEPDDDRRVLTVTIYDGVPVRAVSDEGVVRGVTVEEPLLWPPLMRIAAGVLLALALVGVLLEDRTRVALATLAREPTARRAWTVLAISGALILCAALADAKVGYDRGCNPAVPAWYFVAAALGSLALLTAAMGGIAAVVAARRERTIAAVAAVAAALACLYYGLLAAVVTLVGCLGS